MNECEETALSLEETMLAMERCYVLQNTLIRDYCVPLIYFTLDIPGAEKVLEGVPQAFDEGCERIEHILERNGISFFLAECVRDTSGYGAYYCADEAPEKLKRLLTPLEDGSTLGRLYDIDVICTDGLKMSREELLIFPRRCLLCGGNAHDCSRKRLHTLDERLHKIKEILTGKEL